jgi:hypothetical protein
LAEEKFSESTVPSGAVGKAFADGFYVFADGFGHSAKDLFPVVFVDSHGRQKDIFLNFF